MADVNQLAYAQNFLRLEDSVAQGSTFMANSGAWYGNLLGIIIILFALAVIAVLIWSFAHKVWK